MTATQPADVVLSVRLTPAEADFLRWRANAAGMTMPDQIRAALAALPPYVIVAPRYGTG